MAQQAGIQLDPNIMLAERMAEDRQKQQQDAEKRRQFDAKLGSKQAAEADDAGETEDD